MGSPRQGPATRLQALISPLRTEATRGIRIAHLKFSGGLVHNVTFNSCTNTMIERDCTQHQSSVTSGGSPGGERDDVSRTRRHFPYAPSIDRGN
jgi:hypothetical protein